MSKPRKKTTPRANVSFQPPSEMTPEERMKFLNEHPTRQEVANFVSAYLSTEFLPGLLTHINQQDNRNLALISICQSVLISQGIITQDEMEALMQKWEQAQQQAEDAAQKQAEEDALGTINDFLKKQQAGGQKPDGGPVLGVVK